MGERQGGLLTLMLAGLCLLFFVVRGQVWAGGSERGGEVPMLVGVRGPFALAHPAKETPAAPQRQLVPLPACRCSPTPSPDPSFLAGPS